MLRSLVGSEMCIRDRFQINFQCPICRFCWGLNIASVCRCLSGRVVMTARSRSRSAGLSRGSAPDLRRVLDVHRHSAITLTSAQHHTSLDVDHSAAATGADNDMTQGTARLPTEAEAEVSRRRDEVSRNGVVNNHHHPHHHHQQQQQQVTTSAAATTTVKLDDVFKISEHVPVRDCYLTLSSQSLISLTQLPLQGCYLTHTHRHC